MPDVEQEQSTNCGTKAADVSDNFLASKHNANPPNILVHFATTMTSQRLSVQSTATSATNRQPSIPTTLTPYHRVMVHIV